jgi:membrane protease YdiL (CAAX protease family)
LRNLFGNRQRNRVCWSVLLILASTITNVYLIGLIPIDRLPLSNFWRVILERSLSSAADLVFIWLLYPKSLNRLRIHITKRKALISLALVLNLVLPSLLKAHFQSFSLSQIIEGFVFAFFIGIDEEIFSRGLIFSTLEQYGIWVAAIVSSIHFGLLHLENVIWGGQSLAYTLAQVVNAVAFGFLCVGLMLYTGSIWIPIIFHGLSDTPMQFESIKVFAVQVTGNPNWPAVLAQAAIYCTLGWVLINLGRQDTHQKFVRWMKNYFLKLRIITEGLDQ